MGNSAEKAGIDPTSIAISVNELPASRAQQTFTIYNSTNVSLNGDSALGLSYFKGLNAGLEALAKYFVTLKPAIVCGLDNQAFLRTKLAEYQDWFSAYADKKVEEVKQYSAVRVRSLLKLVKIVHLVKGFSRLEIEPDRKPLIDTYYHLLANKPPDTDIEFDPYPHRSYDPNIKLGQFDYIPIAYSLKKIAKIFIDFVKPYKGTYQSDQDFKQPLVGLVNCGTGLVKLLVGLVTLDIYRFGDGIFSLARGAIEILTTPLSWTLKPLLRRLITAGYSVLVKIEDNEGIKKLVVQGEALLADQTDDDFSFFKIQQILGLCNDLDRKFNKQLARHQGTRIDTNTELELINKLRLKEPLTREKTIAYFSLFGGKFFCVRKCF